MSEWQASHGRVVLFPLVSMSSTSPSSLELYRRVWDSDPENFQRSANPLVPSAAQGKRDGLGVGCVVQQSRIDFNLTPRSDFPIQDSLPLIDKNRLDAELLNITDKVGQAIVSGPIVRVAVNLQFMKVKANFSEANRELLSVIPSHYGVRVTTEEDFIFQINRPFSGHVVNVRMNSIMKWSVERIGVMTFALPPGQVISPGSTLPPGAPVQETREFIAATVGFDSNNMPVPAHTPLSAEQQSSLLKESLGSIARLQEEIKLVLGGPRC